jgi:hypothetical protein
VTVLLLSIFALPVHAADFCPDLQAAIDAAPGEFVSLRGEALPNGEWKATRSLPGVEACGVWEGLGLATWTCRVASGTDTVALQAQYEALIAALPTCWRRQWHQMVPTGSPGNQRMSTQPVDVTDTELVLSLRPDRAASERTVIDLSLRRMVGGLSSGEADAPPLDDGVIPTTAVDELPPERPPLLNLPVDGPALTMLGGSYLPGLLDGDYQGEPAARALGWSVDGTGGDLEERFGFLFRYGRDVWDLRALDEPLVVTRNRFELLYGLHLSPRRGWAVLPAFQLLAGVGRAWGWQAADTDAARSRMMGWGFTYQAALPIVTDTGGEFGFGIRPWIGRSAYGNRDRSHTGIDKYDYDFMLSWEAGLGLYLVTW